VVEVADADLTTRGCGGLAVLGRLDAHGTAGNLCPGLSCAAEAVAGERVVGLVGEAAANWPT